MKAVLIDPTARTVSEVELPTGERAQSRLLEQTIGRELDIRSIAPPAPIGLQAACDDNGMAKRLPCFFLNGYHWPFPGKVLFFGYDRAGETCACPLSAQWFTENVRWAPHDEAYAFVEASQATSAAQHRAAGATVTREGLVNIIVYQNAKP